MNTFKETMKIISYNFSSEYNGVAVNYAMSVNETNKKINDTLNGNINMAGSYVNFRFTDNCELLNEQEMAKLISSEFISHIKLVATEIKSIYCKFEIL